MKRKLIKKEDGGPGDPRQRYNDSLTLHNLGVHMFNIMNESGTKGYVDRTYKNNATDFKKYFTADTGIDKPFRQDPIFNRGSVDKDYYDSAKKMYRLVTSSGIMPSARYQVEGNYYYFDKPSASPEPQVSKVQAPTKLAGSVPQIGQPTGGTGQLAGGPSNFSFTGRDDQGQQATRYFPDLASWTNATNTMGYSNREVTNNGQQANATGYQFKDGGMKVKLTKADLGLSMPTSPLAQIGQGPAPIQAPQLYRTPGFQQNPNGPSNPNQQGDINWDHVMASYVAQNLASGMVSRFSPNSQQNATQRFNKQQFNPMNFLPYTQNNSVQAQFGTPQMRSGGQVMSDGGYFGGSDDEMRKWILGEDESTNDVQPDTPQQPQQEVPQYNDEALQFANFVQMMGLDQEDGEKSPEDQDEGNMYGHGGPVTDGELYEILGDEASDEHLDRLAKGGWIQKANASIKRRGTKGVCTGSKFGGPSCRPGTRRYALAKTFKHMAHKRKKHEDGGPVGPNEMDLSPETIIGLIGQGYQFDV